MRPYAAWLFTTALLAFSAAAQSAPQYRAFWVDTFNTSLANHNDVLAVVNNAKAAKANAILAQVRRRGDSWYLNSLEPTPDFISFSPAGFDPLADLIATAHGQGIEVHAFCIIGAVWNKNPTFSPTATLGPPLNPNHVFNLHGGYDPATKTVVPGPNNWLTRTLIPDGTASVAFQGHRIGSDFWIDLGHPAAAAYTFDVLMQLVRNYDLDGLHLDRIRYPELSVSGQTPSTGTSTGYNSTSIERFRRHYNVPAGSPPPDQKDPRWSQWRRDQVSNLVRRVYLNMVATKPQMKLSAALIAFGAGPASEAAWNSAEAYWRVYQDWRAWTEEGILDIAMPMAYKREHTSTESNQFNLWLEWLRSHQYRRAGVIGVGGLLNSIEGTLRQTRRSLQPQPTGEIAGVVFYSMATSNVAVTNNPYSDPPNQNTPQRPFSEFASGLTTGASVNNAPLYEPVNPAGPVFAVPAPVPVFSWKSQPTRGHLMGLARRSDQSAIDTANVSILDPVSNLPVRTTATDGNGFFGAVDLQPGQYLVKVDDGGAVYYSCIATVSAGLVAQADAGYDAPPQITAPPHIVTSTDGEACFTQVDTGQPTVSDNCGDYQVSGTRSDGLPLNAPYPQGSTTITWKVVDIAGQSASASQTVTVNDTVAPRISAPADIVTSTDPDACSVRLNAGQPVVWDNCGGYGVSSTRSDGLPMTAPYAKGTTTVAWTAVDGSGLSATASQSITVNDTVAPLISEFKANTNEIWPPNHQMVDVRLHYKLTDNCGLPTATLSVSSSEPEDGLGDGDSAPDFIVTSDHQVSLRAERQAQGTGRVYTIRVTAVDGDGNSSSATTTVTVPISQRP